MKLFGYNLSKEKPTQKTFEFKANDWKEQIIELSKIEIPTIKENKSKGWVEYGDDNLYPERLLEYLDGSALHNGIVIGKSKLVAGGNILIDGVELNVWNTTADPNQAVIVNSTINNRAGNASWYDIKNWIALDWIISGNYCLEIIWSMDFSKIVAVNYIPWTKIRPGIKNEEGEITHYYYKEDWSERKGEIKIIQAFDEASKNYVVGEDEVSEYSHNQLLYVKNNWPGQEYFGRPTYFGALSDIKASEMISKWNLNSLENGFTPSVIIKFPVSPSSKEESDYIMNNIRNQFSPRKGGGQKVAIIFSNGIEQMPQIEPIVVENIDRQMQELKAQVENSIVAGHMVTSKELVGLPGNTGFAAQDLDVAWNIFYNSVIQDEKMNLERVFQMILEVNGFIPQSRVQFETKNPTKIINS
jgi:hypothetical protein